MSLALVSDNGASLSYPELDLALQFGRARRLSRGRQVAIVTRSNWFGAHAIAMLNGAVDALLLCPTDVSRERRRCFFDAGGIDAVVTDDREALEGRERIGDEDVQSLLQVDDRPANASSSTRWLLATSGTTNDPKLIEHTTRSLCWSVSRRFSDDSVVWALCYGVMRFAGLQVLLQSLCAGATLAIPAENTCLAQQNLLLRTAGVQQLLCHCLLLAKDSDAARVGRFVATADHFGRRDRRPPDHGSFAREMARGASYSHLCVD